MKKLFLVVACLTACLATQAQDIQLPAPTTNQKSLSTVEALRTRHSVRSYDAEELTNQGISNLCWAAFGITRDGKHRTAPTAMNKQEIRLFVFTKQGVYEYIAKNNLLKEQAAGDHRQLIAGVQGKFVQDFAAEAPVSLLMVIDFGLFGKQDTKAMQMGCIDAGNVSENINLYCQAVGLATVPRATMDAEGISQLLKLTNKQLPILNNPVGYEKK